MKIIKNILITLFLIAIPLTVYYFRADILKFIKQEKLNNLTITITNNSYARNYSYHYVSLTDDFISKSKEQTINIIYTIINSGIDEFTFYCDTSYSKCVDDFKDILDDNNIISNINNFVHPYNSFSLLTSSIKDDEITILPVKKYNEDDIISLNNKIDEIISSNINNNMSTKTKIEIIHDYIINNSKYVNDSNTKNGKATDILLRGVGICSSYTDAMALFLNRFGINNYKIASTNHIWNLVYINNEWLHLDLTFDDPVTTDGSNMLLKDMFLINTLKLESINDENHKFDYNVYFEAK